MYHDVSASWHASEQFEVGLGVRNLTNKKPPVFDNSIDQNTDPSTYDTLGRAFFGTFRVKF